MNGPTGDAPAPGASVPAAAASRAADDPAAALPTAALPTAAFAAAAFAALLDECAALLSGPGTALERVDALCALVRGRVPRYDWFGFYVAYRDAPLLFLGPFRGEPTEHVEIPFGRGVCGRAAAEGRTVVVDDVTAEANYLACSLKVRSEVVAPVYAGGEVAGEIDIDSHSPAAFGAADLAFLGALAGLVAPLVEAIRRPRPD